MLPRQVAYIRKYDNNTLKIIKEKVKPYKRKEKIIFTKDGFYIHPWCNASQWF